MKRRIRDSRCRASPGTPATKESLCHAIGAREGLRSALPPTVGVNLTSLPADGIPSLERRRRPPRHDASSLREQTFTSSAGWGNLELSGLAASGLRVSPRGHSEACLRYGPARMAATAQSLFCDFLDENRVSPCFAKRVTIRLPEAGYSIHGCDR
jgi:hypothetical protein